MFETRIQMGEGQHLTLVNMASNVALTAWAEPDVWLRLRDGQESDLAIEQTEAGPAVSARVSCEVRVPASLTVKVREVKGNMKASGVAVIDAEQVRGNLKLNDVPKATVAEVYGNLRAESLSSLRVVGTVFGDATLKAVDAGDVQNVRGNLLVKGSNGLRASRIGGNLQAKELGGALNAASVGGNASLKSIAGIVTVEQVAGNLVAKHLTGGAKVPKIGGNLVLNGELGTGRTYHLRARGNAALRFFEGASAHLTLKAGGHLVSSLSLADGARQEGTLTGTLGDGGAEIVVEARGNVLLGSTGAGIGADLGEEISRQVEASLQAIDLEAIGRQVSEEMEAALSRLQVKLESVDWERLGVEAQSGVERAMEQLQRNMGRVVEKTARQQERLERKLERERRRVERMERKRQRKAGQREREVEVEVEDWVAEGAYQPADPGPDLDAERLSILRMVEQGQISPQEAEMLLDALE